MFYYLNSRYYNPNWCRFINADDVKYLNSNTTLQYNLFTYCCNSPIFMVDSFGMAATYISPMPQCSTVILNAIKKSKLDKKGIAVTTTYVKKTKYMDGYEYEFSKTVGSQYIVSKYYVVGHTKYAWNNYLKNNFKYYNFLSSSNVSTFIDAVGELFPDDLYIQIGLLAVSKILAKEPSDYKYISKCCKVQTSGIIYIAFSVSSKVYRIRDNKCVIREYYTAY